MDRPPVRFEWDGDRYSLEQMLERYLQYLTGYSDQEYEIKPRETELVLIFNAAPSSAPSTSDGEAAPAEQFKPFSQTELLALLVYRYPIFRAPHVKLSVALSETGQITPIDAFFQSIYFRRILSRERDYIDVQLKPLKKRFARELTKMHQAKGMSALTRFMSPTEVQKLSDELAEAEQALSEAQSQLYVASEQSSLQAAFSSRVIRVIERFSRKIRPEIRPSQWLEIGDMLEAFVDALEGECASALVPKTEQKLALSR